MRMVAAPGERIVLDDGQRRYRAEECEGLIASMAALFQAVGCVPGDTVALLSRNRAEYPLWLMGAVAAGLWIVPLNWHLRRNELHHIVADSGASLVLVEPELVGELPELPHRVLDEALAQQLQATPPRELHADLPAGGIMLYTSGTTGLPRGVRRSQPARLGALLESWQQRGRAVGLDGAGPHLVTGPLYHAAPLLYALYDWVNGAPMLVMRQFDAAAALDWIERAGVCHSHWVPTMFVRALQLPEARRKCFRAHSLRRVLHGAAPIAPEIKRRMIDWWGPVLVEYWGGSESGAVTRIDSPAWLQRPGSVGQALPGFEVHAVDESGRRLPPGCPGLLAVRRRDGHRLLADDKAGSALLLGDIGRVEEDGYVYLLGREGHTIISGGVNIYPAEVEAVLSSHPAVVDVLVQGEADPEWGERVVALVVAADGHGSGELLAAELLDFAARRLASYKLPRRIDWVSSLPRTDAGKLSRRHLKLQRGAGA